MKHPFVSKIPSNAHSEKLLKPIRAAAKTYLDTPVESLPYTQYVSYYKTGNRTAYEAIYTEHRRRLNVFTAMVLSAEEEKWLLGLEDILWAICDEFTWALPAHVRGREQADMDEHMLTVDLFAAETAFALSEVYALLGERLAPLVRERVYREIKRRIIDPYMEQNLSWPKNNWSAVCAGSVGSAMLLLGLEDTFERAKERLLHSMQDFLESYHDDGCCMEGVLYWGYGFGYFCFFAALVREYSHGTVDLFKDEKVRRIASFRQKAFLHDDLIVPFADAPHNLNCHIGLNHFLAREYTEVTAPDERYEAILDDDTRYRFADFLRDFYWYDETQKPQQEKAETACWEEAQWYIRKEKGFAFACKGGDNDEPHNHNDIGGFVLLDGRAFIIDDLGWSEYLYGYFTDRRYEFLCTSSRGHSVPIVNGTYQQPGKQYAAKLLEHDEKSCTLELSGAYDVGGLSALKRSFTVEKDGVTLTDTVSGENIQITERFVTRIEPTIEGNAVRIGQYRLICDTKADISTEISVEISVSSEQFEPRLNICKMEMRPVETAYLIDFRFSATSWVQQLRFTIQQV